MNILDKIFEIIPKEYWIFVIVLFVVCYVLWKFFKLYMRFHDVEKEHTVCTENITKQINSKFDELSQNITTHFTIAKDNYTTIRDNFATIENSFTTISNNFLIINNRLRTLETGQFGASHSPLQLKPEYKKIILESGIDKEIDKEIKQKIIDLAKQWKVRTELDAQKIISMISSGLQGTKNTLVLRDQIDFSKIDKIAYEKGLTSSDVETIITLYLWEILIPEIMKNKQ